MPATDTQSLLNGAAGFNNASPGEQTLLKLSLLRAILLNLNPMAATDTQSLLNSAQCFNCYGPGVWPLIELQLLALIVANGTGGGGGTSGVSSVNALTGALSILAGANVTVTPSGNTLTIGATGGSGSNNLSGSGSPVGTAIPSYVGQNYTDLTTPGFWVSTGLTNTSWLQLI